MIDMYWTFTVSQTFFLHFKRKTFNFKVLFLFILLMTELDLREVKEISQVHKPVK